MMNLKGLGSKWSWRNRSTLLFVLRPFCFSAPNHFIPLLNLHPLTFGLTLVGWFIYIYLSLGFLMEISFFYAFFISAHFFRNTARA